VAAWRRPPALREPLHPHLIVFHLVYGRRRCLHLPPCMHPSHYVHLNESLSREGGNRRGGGEREEGGMARGTGDARTGGERQLQRNEYGRGEHRLNRS